jgi:hypothetical protein
MSTSIGSLVGGVLLPLNEPIADEFNARKSTDLDSGVHGSWEEDNWDEDASRFEAVGANLAEGFVVFAFGVAFGPLANQDIKLFCFIGSAWGLELGAMVLAPAKNSKTWKERNVRRGTRWSLFVHVSVFCLDSLASGIRDHLDSEMDNHEESTEDILNDSLAFLGGDPVVDSDTVSYGPLTLTIAPKVPLLLQLDSVICGLIFVSD